MKDVVIVGDTGGYVRAFDKLTGRPITYGGYPLQLSTEPYKAGQQGERWWEPIGGAATQMTVAANMMLVGVNSNTEELTLLKAYKLFKLPDLYLQYLDTPPTATADGFDANVRAVCQGCREPLTTSVSLTINGYELSRRSVTFRPENDFGVNLTWASGPVPAGANVTVVATVDPDNQVDESDETNNSLRATVVIPTPADDQNGDRWGSDLTH
jgi:hypothetical protein